MSKFLTVGDVCNITTGSLDSNAFVENGKYPFYTCAKEPTNIDTYAFDDDVVLVAGNNAQGNFHVNRFKGKFNAYQRTYILTSKGEKSIDYIYYLLSLALKLLKDKSQGSQTKFLTIGILKEIHVPNLANSQIVAKVLSDLDAKIELNNRINRELEAMAKTLYDYWFVQFDFPNEQGKPYKSSGGKMVYNSGLKRLIPQGWDVKYLKDLFTFEKGVEPGSSEYIDYPINENFIKFFRVGDIDGESIVYVDSTNKKYAIAQEMDVIVTFDGSVGKLGFGLNGAFSGGLRKIYDKSNQIDNSLIYFIFRDERIIATIHKYATGSILLHASSSINHLKIPFEKNIYLKLQEITKPIFYQMVKNKKENQKLAELRDWLLPMLMNGQVTVSEL